MLVRIGSILGLEIYFIQVKRNIEDGGGRQWNKILIGAING